MKTQWLDRMPAVPLPYYTLCTTRARFAAAKKHLNAINPPDDRWITPGAHATTHTFDKPDGKTCIVICINAAAKVELEQFHSLLVHEGVHLYQAWVRDILREPDGKASAEVEAYTIQWISQQLFYEFKRQTRGRIK